MARSKVYDTEQESRDLGFGSVLAQQPHLRLLNRDGSFNVQRPRPGFWASFGSYHTLLSLSWPRFWAVIVLAYVALNALFAAGYLACGPGGLVGRTGLPGFPRAFFFSVHTFAPIGYGHVVPVGWAANLLVALESLSGLLGFAFVAALIFARFSRPVADILFSRRAVIAPYRGITALEFRIINRRENQLIEVAAKITFARFEINESGERVRRFDPLPLEREKVAFFALNWTVVHPIDESSPLYGWTRDLLLQAEAEFLILLTAIDETFSQTVHSRSSYTAGEVEWDAHFAPLLARTPDGRLTLDWEQFHHTEPVGRTVQVP